MRYLPAVANGLGVYPRAVAESVGRFPRLVALAAHVPIDTAGAMSPDRRVVLWKRGTTYYADEVYFAAETVRRPGMGGNAWQVDETRHRCALYPGWWDASTKFGLPAAEARRPSVVVIDRSDASSRAVLNHAALLAGVTAAVGDVADVVNFRGTEMNVSATIGLFREATVVLGPHGAALAWVLFMRPNTTLLEIAYPGVIAMPWPADYFATRAAAQHVRYSVSMALRGEYTSSMEVDVAEIASATRAALLSQ